MTKIYSNNTIKELHIYDPLDIPNEHKRQDTKAYIVAVLNRHSEHAPEIAKIWTIDENATSFTFEEPKHQEGKMAYIGDLQVSPDFQYAVTPGYFLYPQELKNASDYCDFVVRFFSIKNNSFEELSCVRFDEHINVGNKYPTVILVKNSTKAIISIPEVTVALVDITTGKILSEWPTNSIHQLYYHVDK